jgi:hypothetical protein
LRSIPRVLTPDFGESYAVAFSQSRLDETTDENTAERLKFVLEDPRTLGSISDDMEHL